jgi:hypothetical protein
MAKENLDNVDEPVANPYNANKPWSEEGVTGKSFISADESLFYSPKPEVVDDLEDDNIDDISIQKSDEELEKEMNKARSNTYKKTDWKKRYDDMKRHYDRKVAEFKTEKERLQEQARANRPTYTPPKTQEELATFREDNPDIYAVVETIAHTIAQDQITSLNDEIDRLKKHDAELAHDKAKIQLLQLHPDLEQITSDSAFHEWAEKQPTQIQDWIYRNGTNAKLAARAIDLYKKDQGITKEDKDTNISKQHKSDERASAAEAVSVAAKPEPKTTDKRIWKVSEIAALSLNEYMSLEKELDEAGKAGRIIKG